MRRTEGREERGSRNVLVGDQNGLKEQIRVYAARAFEDRTLDAASSEQRGRTETDRRCEGVLEEARRRARVLARRKPREMEVE
jgi:hypothetical protein